MKANSAPSTSSKNTITELIKNHATKIRFLIVGGTNTAIDFVLLFVFTALGLPVVAANIISTSAAFTFSYFANKHFTFQAKNTSKKQVVLFFVVTLSGLWILQPLVMFAVTQLPLPGTAALQLFIAKIIATLFSLTWNYILYAKYVFPSPES